MYTNEILKEDRLDQTLVSFDLSERHEEEMRPALTKHVIKRRQMATWNWLDKKQRVYYLEQGR